MTKPNLAIYWAASCGGCEISVANLHEKLLDIDANFNLIFCPCLVDTKKKDIEALPDKSIAITLFNGAIRTSENEEMAHLMRAKSKVLIAYGACAQGGGIPALINFHSRKACLSAIYKDNPSIENPRGIVPAEKTDVAEGSLHLPSFYERVKTLAQVIDVDYFIPGCPPETAQLWNVVDALLKGAALPPRGSVLGAGLSSVCDECKKKKSDNKTIKAFKRVWEIVPDKEKCLLEQGLICMGPATRSGCGGLCPEVNMPCIGCYGPPPGVSDQGGKMASTLGSILDIEELKGKSEDDIFRSVTDTVRHIPDYGGLFYKFGLADSMIKGKTAVED